WLDAEAVAARLAREGLPAEQRRAAAERWVADAVERVNADLAKFEQVKRFRVMDVPLTVAGGHLTSTLKLRRKEVWQSFRADFESMYEEAT
ncbi:MAG: long-chain fatty acid--CoA ligase, partial [Myxococcales bacterium]|nr:long-chain fatty acid--CoA ligase [Myxococcales bacterium]